MGRLTDTAAERIKQNRDARMPDWVPMLGAVGLVVVLVWVGISAVLGDDTPTRGATAVPAAPAGRPGGQVTETTAPSGTPTTVEVADPSGTVEVPTADGSSADVAADAVALAEQVAVARARGDVTQVPVVDGADRPVLTPTNSRPEVADVTLASTGAGGALTFVVTVDPDGAGPDPDSYATVTVVKSDQWRWNPAA
jgi:hypothetical protein